MRNGLVQLGAWAAATGAAVALSWFGVHAVLVDSTYQQPQALPLPSGTPSRTADAPSDPPAPSGSASGASASSASPSPTPRRSATPSPTVAKPSSVRSYLVPGGRVALDMGADSAGLVSATPDADWQMQVWHGDQWLRVDFTKGSQTNSVFATWNGHPPDVQTVVR